MFFLYNLYFFLWSSHIILVTSLTVPPVQYKRLTNHAKKHSHISKLFSLQKDFICIVSISLLCVFSNPSISIAESSSIVSATSSINNKKQAHADILSWNLPNGKIELSNPLLSFSHRTLRNPKLLGSGGGGAVFAMQEQSSKSDQKVKEEQQVAIKISWVSSAESVEKECKIFRILEEKKVRNVEKCLDIESYPFDNKRVMIALKPVINDATSSVSDVDEVNQIRCVKAIMETLVDMLASNVVTTDVQILIDKDNGDVTFIDMTEATVVESDPPTFLDMTKASSFISEMFALIPEKLLPTAYVELATEIDSSQELFMNYHFLEILKDVVAS